MALNGNNNQWPHSAARRMVYRHPTDHTLGGVCAGLANFLDWDPVLVRALWVVATFATSGAGFLVYLLLWLLLPVGTQAAGQVRPAAIQFNNLGAGRIAKVFLILGALWLLSNLGILPALAEMAGGFLRIFFWPLLLIGIGYMLLQGRNHGLRKHLGALHEQVQGAAAEMPSASTVRNAAEDVRAQMPFRRSRTNRKVLGVCGGLSEKTGLDVNLIRLATLVLIAGSMGLGLFVYLAAALLVPEEGSHWAPADDIGSHWVADAAQDVPVMQGASAPAAAPTRVTPQPAASPDVTPLGDETVQL